MTDAPVGIALVGAGAFGAKHLDSLRRIDGVRIVSIVDPVIDRAQAAAVAHGVGHATREYDEALARSDVDAVVLCSPTPLHASQAIAALRAGKHVQVEIPLADSLDDAEAVVALQRETGLVAMCGHTRRFNPGHRWIHERIAAGTFALQQLDVQTYFLRRSNLNALGQPRSWTDHLLWHHAAHTVDLFQYQAGSPVVAANALQGPPHPVLGIAMDLSIQLLAANGALCTLSLSFNNDGPLGSAFRYIGDAGTYLARDDDLTDGYGRPVADATGGPSGVERQDRAFIDAIRGSGEPEASVARVLPCYRLLDRLQTQLADAGRRPPTARA